jgi:hypothetical protein
MILAAMCVAGGMAGMAQNAAQPAATPTVQERKDQLAVDSAKLLKLATELKVDVDKSTKDQLSVAVIKKADEVEKLARKVRDEMKMIPAN